MVIRIVFGVFLVLHGLVHLLYLGQSARWFELQPGMNWPDGSWSISRLLGIRHTRTISSVSCVLASAAFIVAAFAVFFSLSWRTEAAIASAALSGGIFVIFWNGRLQNLANQGAIALLINVAILIAVLVFRWPDLDS